jgi:hypothetical protein
MKTAVFLFALAVFMFCVASSAEQDDSTSSLSGELGMVIGMKFDHNNRVLDGHYTEYTVTNKNGVTAIEATPNIRYAPALLSFLCCRVT